jgi:hypothetical protein
MSQLAGKVCCGGGHDVQFSVSASYVKNIEGTCVLVNQKRLCADMDILKH